MSLKRHIQWIHEQKKFFGYATNQQPNQNNEYPVASKVLVFMVTVLNDAVSIPVAYYCIQSLDAQGKRVLLSQVLRALHEIEVKVVNITFDGDPAHLAMCELMGANFDPSNAIPYIIHPVDGSRVYTIFDACHMIKLLRSTLGDYSTIQDPKNGKIEWQYFTKLVAYREKNSFITHKMNKHYILYWKNRMNVKLAVQVLSNGSASSMNYLRKSGDSCFRHSKATSIFASNINKSFDILNAKRIKENQPYKSAINRNNAPQIFAFFKKMIDYLKSLRLRGILCTYSRRRTGFIGFIINMMGAMEMYEQYVVPGDLPHLSLFYNSQDMLESFFRFAVFYANLEFF